MPLLTFHGTFLVVDGAGALWHRPLEGLASGETLVELDDPAFSLRDDYALFVECDVTCHAFVPMQGPLARCGITLSADRRSLTIRRGREYLCAEDADGRAVFGRMEAAGWETFIQVTANDLRDLACLQAHAWICETTGELLRAGEIRIGPRMMLHVGQTLANLADNLPVLAGPRNDGAGQGYIRRNVSLVFDGWKIRRYRLFRPMIYTVAFRGPAIIRQLHLCLASLAQPAGYKGAVHVITDQTSEDILAAVPSLDPATFSTQTVRPADWLGYNAAKLCILDHPDAALYQPILFVDPDTIFSRNIEDLLLMLAMADRMCAPAEVFSPLKDTLSVGARLFTEDQIEVGDACGFNAGTFGFQSIAANWDVLVAIRAVLAGYSRHFGRDALKWADQEAANYVGFKLKMIDTSLLTRFVEHGFNDALSNLAAPKGLVHFWPDGYGMQRAEAMEQYLAAITNEAARTSDQEIMN